MEEQLNRLAQEVGSKATVTLGFRLDDGAISAQSQRLTSAVQQSLDRTSLKISNVQLDKNVGNGFTKALEALGSQASKSLSDSIGKAGRRIMPAAVRR